MKLVIYLIRNLIDGKVYIGQTSNFKHRKTQHLVLARTGKKHPLYAAIRKYGEDNFAWKVIARAFDEETLDCLEQMLINKYRSRDSRFGYNLSAGGIVERGFKNPQSKEWIERRAAANRGQKRSKEARRRMSIAAKNRTDDRMQSDRFKIHLKRLHRLAVGNTNCLGKHWKISKQGRINISKAQKKRFAHETVWNKGKKIVSIDRRIA